MPNGLRHWLRRDRRDIYHFLAIYGKPLWLQNGKTRSGGAGVRRNRYLDLSTVRRWFRQSRYFASITSIAL